MPKKENRPGVADLKKIANKKDTKNKADMLNELAIILKSSIKGSKNEKVEESELEEDVNDESINLQNFEFHQFMNALEETEPGSPALERRALSAPGPIFVGGMQQGNIADEKESDKFKYVPGAGKEDEPKYISSESDINNMERFNIEEAGRRQDFFSHVNQKALFENSELSRFQSQDEEMPKRVERFDTERAGKKNPFDSQESTFERYKPKFPKN